MTMLEKAAKALYNEHVKWHLGTSMPPEVLPPWDMLHPDHPFQRKAVEQVKAVLRAIRQPDIGMSRGYVRAHGYDPDAPAADAPLLFGAGAVVEYQRWIDAILEGK